MEDKYRKLVDERIGRALEAGSTGAVSSPKICSPGCASDAGPSDTGTSEGDEFRKLLDAACRQRETRRRILRRRAVSLAAVFVCIFSLLGGLYFKGFFQPEESQAGRKPDTSVNLENGSVIIGGDGNGNMGTWTGQFSAYEDIPDTYRQEMIWFDDIPEMYDVKEIRIQRTENCQKVKIVFIEKNADEIKIEEEKRNDENADDITSVLNNFEHQKVVNGIAVYYKQTEESVKYIFTVESTAVKITGDKHMDKEIEAMIASVRTD